MSTPPRKANASDVLAVISASAGKLHTKADQDELLGRFITKEDGAEVDDEVKSRRVEEMRQGLEKRMEEHGLDVSMLNRKGEGRKYTLEDLFAEGPEKVFDPSYLEKMGLATKDKDLPDLGGDDDDPKDADYKEEKEITVKPVSVKAATTKKIPASRSSKPSTASRAKSQKRKSDEMSSVGDGVAVGGSEKKKPKPTTRKSVVDLTEEDGSKVDRSGLFLQQPKIAASEADQKKWTRESGFWEEPKIMPTQQPRPPHEIIPFGNAGWVEGQMKRIQSSLFNAMNDCITQEGIDRNAMPDFPAHPGEELKKLYKTMFGKDLWQECYVRLRTQQTQDATLLSLFGASIYMSVLAVPLPWDLSIDIPKNLGEKTTAILAGIIADLGHDFDNVLRYAVGRQITLDSFQKDEVVTHAEKLAGALVITLMPHIELAAKLDTKPEVDPRDRSWVVRLREAFSLAIILKQTLRSSPLGPFKMIWPNPEKAVKPSDHSPCFEYRNTTHIVTPVLPGIRDTKKQVLFCKAWVVPREPKEDQVSEA